VVGGREGERGGVGGGGGGGGANESGSDLRELEKLSREKYGGLVMLQVVREGPGESQHCSDFLYSIE